jgi:hypothetical protein
MAYDKLHPNFQGDTDDPLSNAVAVVPDDNADLTYVTRAIYIGGSGNIVVDFAESGSTIAMVGVIGGNVYPFRVKRIRATNTTAASIVALW